DEQAGSKEQGMEEDRPAPAPAEEEEESFGNGAGTFLNPCCCLGEPWALMDHLPGLKCRGVNLTGYLAMNPFIWNTSNPADRFNGPVTMTDRSNDFQM